VEQSDQARRLDAVRRRVERMGLAWREAPGGQSLLVRVPLKGGPLPGPDGTPLPEDRVVVSTVELDRIKCLTPRPLFFLPLLSIAGCATGPEVEERIRRAWRERHAEVTDLREWLEARGCEPQIAGAAPLLEIPLGLDDPEARGRAVDRRILVLSGRGPLSGVALRRAEDRRFPLDPALESCADLELAVTARLEELLRIEERLARQARLAQGGLPPPVRTPRPRRSPRVLLVGKSVAGDASLREALRVGGCVLAAAPGAAEALRAFEGSSFELVISDVDLGRSEGTELLVGLRSVPGLEEVPVVLVDGRPRPERRDLARRLGAAGYLARPLDLPRLEAGLLRLAQAPRRRRFTRYATRIAVHSGSADASVIAAQIGRGGMRLQSEPELAVGDVQDYVVALPHGGDRLEVAGQVVYRVPPGPLESGGVGIQFHEFAPGHEERLVAWLRTLEAGRV